MYVSTNYIKSNKYLLLKEDMFRDVKSLRTGIVKIVKRGK